MADELFEDIEGRLSSLDRGMDDGRRRRDNIEAEYHEEKRRIEQERSEAQALRAALLAKGRDEEAGRAAAAGEIERCKRELRDLEDEHAQRQTSWQRRRKELDAMLARVPEKYAGLPVREQDRRRVEQMSDEEVLAVIDQANDGSFWATVRRLFRIGGAMRQGEAASLVKAFVENVRGRLVLEESAHEHRYRAFCDGLNKKIDRQRAVQDSLRTSDKIPELGVFDKRLRALKASYEEKLAALSRTPSFEPGPVLAECRRMSQEAVARLGCADTGAYRPPREFPSQTPIGLVEARGGGNKLCVPYSFDWKRLQGVWFSVDRDLAKAQVSRWVCSATSPRASSRLTTRLSRLPPQRTTLGAWSNTSRSASAR